MKKLWILLLIALLIVPVSATPNPRPIRDGAALLVGMQEAEVASRLDQVSAAHGIDVLIVTRHSLGGESPKSYANSFYDDNCFAGSGVLLLLAMDTRDWYVLTDGACHNTVDIDLIEDYVVPRFSAGDYYEGFLLFTEIVDVAMENRDAAGSVAVRGDGTVTFSHRKWYDAIWIILILGIVAGGISVAVMAAGMKKVRKQSNAGAYVTEEGLELTRREDRYLYQTITRRAKPKSSSSSGGSRGGRGGKF